MYNNTFSPPLLIESWLERVSNTSSNTFPIQTINHSVRGSVQAQRGEQRGCSAEDRLADGSA